MHRWLGILLSFCLLASAWSPVRSLGHVSSSSVSTTSSSPLPACCCSPDTCRMANCPGNAGSRGTGVATCAASFCKIPLSAASAPDRNLGRGTAAYSILVSNACRRSDAVCASAACPAHSFPPAATSASSRMLIRLRTRGPHNSRTSLRWCCPPGALCIPPRGRE